MGDHYVILYSSKTTERVLKQVQIFIVASAKSERLSQATDGNDWRSREDIDSFSLTKWVLNSQLDWWRLTTFLNSYGN